MVEEKDDKFNPYHYWKKRAIEIIDDKVIGFELD